MATRLHDFSSLNKSNDVSITNGREAVRYDYRGTTNGGGIKCRLHNKLRLVVKRASSLIKEQNLW
ncbi:hypothetical protein IEQ34_012832 [Dendrobium chrysotoxum]|uniref:Uncharacterized protein n=1 Tax=Dendrobium chrysotoxum TaxID=161865 RepID=A0AAV7GPN8_DENCH|nr:hypothetical protein IEQ34_012832 [Dendrobium chrysotoxum]